MSEKTPAVVAPLQTPVMQHTPGPWALVVEDGDMKIAAPPQDPRLATRETLMCDMQHYPWCPSNDADWKLIAAAPELLSSLQIILTRWDGCDDDDTPPAVVEARKVVARAVGAA